VLALLPQLSDQGLDKVHQGLNTAFRERPGHIEPGDLRGLLRPALWVPLVLVLVAAVVYLLPERFSTQTRPAPAAASAVAAEARAPAPAASTAAVQTRAEPAAIVPPEAASEPRVTAAAGGGLLQVSASAQSWVEVLDASGAALLQRMLSPGETVELDGAPPFRLKIGNAAATRLSFRGEPVDLAAATRDNVARLELK
jgi:cytoskeleton protein RodZ